MHMYNISFRSLSSTVVDI